MVSDGYCVLCQLVTARNTICTNLAFSGRNLRKIVFTSNLQSEGKSWMAMHVLANLAQRGRKVVLVDADIDEGAEVDDIADGAGQHHAGRQFLHGHHLFPQLRLRERVTDIAAGLFQLGYDILKSGFATTKLTRELCYTVLRCLEAQECHIARANVVGSEAETLEKIVCNSVGLGVNAGGVEDLLTADDAEEACTLLKSLLPKLWNFKKLFSVFK